MDWICNIEAKRKEARRDAALTESKEDEIALGKVNRDQKEWFLLVQATRFPSSIFFPRSNHSLPVVTPIRSHPLEPIQFQGPFVRVSKRATMVALSLAIVDRNNRPLYLEEFADPQSSLSSLSSSLSPPPPPSDEEMMGVGGFLAESPSVHDSGGGGVGGRCSIRFQFILQAALDRMDTLASLPFDGTRDGMFLGLLMPVEEMRVYGACVRVRAYGCKAVAVGRSQICCHTHSLQDMSLPRKPRYLW